jgi:hypothetical protein
MSSNKNFIPENENLKCAPSKVYSEGSCFTVKSLQKLADAYNREVGMDSNSLIEITDSKPLLIKEISKRISECGNDQLCWLNIDWVKNIKDDDIHNYTFRPNGPQARFKWLNTTNINEVMVQYEKKYNDFKFLGAVPYDFEKLEQLGICNINFDELVSQNIHKIGLVINFDEHWKRGSHWVGLYVNLAKDQIYYFDSYGGKPKSKISEFVKKIALWCYKRHHLNINDGNSDTELDTESEFMKSTKNKYETKMDIEYNKNRHQFKNSECGIYSVNFILRLLKGETFNDICSVITVDEKVNECRKVYFRFE